MLTFDEPTHTYFWHGKPVPNVTRVIAHLTDYSHIPPETLLRAQEEGKAIHKMVELDCKNDLAVDSLPEWMRGRYAGWCRFKEEAGFKHLAAEKQMDSEAIGVAGTADIFCILTKLSLISGVNNIDVKRSLYAGPAIGLQTAGYAELWDRNAAKNERVKHRGSLVLNDNGTYRFTTYDDPDDRWAFLACLQQYRWREKNYGHRT